MRESLISLHELPGNSGEPPLNTVSLGQVAGGIVGIKGQCRGQGRRGQGAVQRSRGQG